jgi:hypothetical protein
MQVTQKQFARKKPDQLVYLELGSGNGGMLLSISEDGFRFRAVSPLRPNGLMPFAFSLDGNRRWQGIGEVEWLEDDGKSGGMRFVEVSPDFRSELDQWLALEPPRGRSGREATSAPAAQPDTMEKIREELRRGYPPAAPKESAQKEAQDASPAAPSAKPKDEPSAEKPSPESGPESAPESGPGIAKPNADAAEPAEPSIASNQPASTAEPNQRRAEVRATSVPPKAERERRSQPAPQQGRPQVDRKPPVEPRSQPFYPPPFTQAAEPETPGNLNRANSAFVKKPAAVPSTPPENIATQSAFQDAPHSTPVAPAPAPSREPAHDSVEAFRRPFRQESRPSYSDRPYIPPPVDPSYDAAWEHARLTAPPESPHLSRAAAGSIIGVALAVILGAMAFNFRQDIGQLVIDLGQEISGDQRAVAPSASPSQDSKPASQTPAEAGASESPGNRPDAANPATAPSTQPSNSANSPADSRSTSAAAAHDTPRSGVRGSTPATSAGGAANHTATGAPTGSAATTGSGGSGANSASGPEFGTEPGSGQEEFNAAREMLRGDHRHRDLTKAVSLLWAGVRKGYVPAEVTLADLYRRGDGVPKSCDQAQVLLVAASKKGSPEARQKLEQMAEEGCSD